MTRAPRSDSQDDRGLAVVEFLVVVLALAVPLAYGVVAVLRVHTAAASAQTSAAAAALAIARRSISPSAAGPLVLTYWHEGVLRPAPGGSDDTAEVAVRQVSVRCRPGPCGRPGSVVTVTVTARVGLPLVPDQWTGVPIEAQQTQVVDRFVAPVQS